MKQDEQKIINCDKHDYIEIACMYSFLVELTLKDNSTLTGKAITTGIQKNKEEYLLLQCENEKRSIPLTLIKTMRALVTNPHFDRVNF